MPVDKFLEVAIAGVKSGSAASMLGALDGHIEKLNVADDEIVALHAKTLWLVLVPVVKEAEEETKETKETDTGKKKATGKQ